MPETKMDLAVEKGKREVLRLIVKDLSDLASVFETMPQNPQGSEDKLSLAEIFSTTQDSIILHFIEQFEGMLDKGYGYTEIAEIMSAKSGLNITPKQLKFQYLRNKKIKEKLSMPSNDQKEKPAKAKKNNIETYKDNQDVTYDAEKALSYLDSDDYPDYGTLEPPQTPEKDVNISEQRPSVKKMAHPEIAFIVDLT